MCDNAERQDQILGYLYDELDPVARQAFDAHLAVCGACRAELAGFEATRGHLAAWTVPEARGQTSGLRLVSPRASDPAQRRRLPGWGLAAAAALVLAASAALANLEVRIGAEGLLVRTGWAQAGESSTGEGLVDVNDVAVNEVAASEGAAATLAPVAQAAGADADWQAALAAMQARLDELEALATRPAGPMRVGSGVRMSDADLLRQVRELVEQSEDRQQRATMMTLRQVMNEFERQRRAELAVIQQGMSQYHGLTNAEIAQQRETLNQLVRVRQEK